MSLMAGLEHLKEDKFINSSCLKFFLVGPIHNVAPVAVFALCSGTQNLHPPKTYKSFILCLNNVVMEMFQVSVKSGIKYLNFIFNSAPKLILRKWSPSCVLFYLQYCSYSSLTGLNF